jgi:hypothetical protein
MEPTPNRRRIAGALRFLADLDAFARECVATGVWNDELTQRRRQRDETRDTDAAESQVQVR